MAKKIIEPKMDFRGQDDKEIARGEFESLKNHPAWKRLIKYYKEKADYWQKIINGDITDDNGKSFIESMEDLRIARLKRNSALQFMELPELIMGMMEIEQPEEIILDPFGKEEEIKGNPS